MTRRVIAMVLAVVLCAATLTMPRRAVAIDNLEYIIPAAVGGAVALILIIAIVMADHDDDEMELTRSSLPEPAQRPRFKLAPDCQPSAAGLPLLCW